MSDKKPEQKQETIKIVTLVACNDKETKARYEVGAEVELSAERAEAAVAAGYAELAKPEI